MRTNYNEIIPFIELAGELGVTAVNFKSLIRPTGVNHPLHAKLLPYDHLENIDVCREIIAIMKKADLRAMELGVKMTREAVTPAIYNRYPELAHDSSTSSEASSTGTSQLFQKPARSVKQLWNHPKMVKARKL